MRKGGRKHRKTLRGGGLGQGYTFAPALIGGVDNGPGAAPYSSCMAEVRPGTIPMPTTGLGLPGMSLKGGKRSGGRRRKTQRGGRYGFDLSQPLGGTPYTGGIPQVMKIPCESSSTTSNRLNQHGGAPGGVGSPFMIAPTAGYTNNASTWTSSVGAPVLLQTPYDARSMNPACLKTGGGRKRRKGSSRKGSRKGRRGSRKN